MSPCLTNPDQDYKDVVTIVGKAECFSKEAVVNEAVTDKIKSVRPPKRYPVVAVYSFQDLTGQRKSVDGIASFSTAVTMAPDAYLIRALKQSRFFKVVERKGIDNLTRERQIIRNTRQTFDDDKSKNLYYLLDLLLKAVL